ncbi:Cj0069 family protein [Paracraurococcus lichenis]|uniref:Cj0069 family protein n=1 Tax=Paracraurococcus lichenis TaxID=3064888 RepID=A0ABT9EBT7_9PROT|nr:Cj0069 family protein [Paracraurococcus sp. LOR1-02]MDO9713671.1 Cj0069 family protein [Paracraurococcus sp. LOR1-02]
MTAPPAAPLRLALVWRGDPRAPDQPTRHQQRLRPLMAALAAAGVTVEPVAWFDEAVAATRDRLLGCDGAMVWVNPLADGQDRSRLDPMLREVAAAGVWVSAHPDVILAMGTKEVLVRTRGLGWGADTHLYESFEALAREFPARLAPGRARMLKRNRGNDGQDVWKVQAAPGAALVTVQAAASDAVEHLPLDAFLARCRTLFEAGGRVVDQVFQPRVGEGMIRCYLSGNAVVGFGEQFPRLPQGAAVPALGMASAKTMNPATEPRFARLRRAMEQDWLPGMLGLVGLAPAALPAVWDADFLLGPRDAAGADTYVLCEINVGSVLPFPDMAVDAIVRTAVARMAEARVARSAGLAGHPV